MFSRQARKVACGHMRNSAPVSPAHLQEDRSLANSPGNLGIQISVYGKPSLHGFKPGVAIFFRESTAMRHFALLAGLAMVLASPSWAAAQQTAPTHYDRVEIGAFGSYLRYNPGAGASDINFVGLGGRVDVSVVRNLALEAQMDYDFARNYTTTSSGTNSGGISTNFVTTGLRPLTGLFGPKLQFGAGGPVEAFVTGQVGFVDLSTHNPNNVSGSGFTNTVSNVGGASTYFAAYPGGGLEFFLGPIGLRADVGDEIYLNNGTHSNLRVTFGPSIRF